MSEDEVKIEVRVTVVAATPLEAATVSDEALRHALIPLGRDPNFRQAEFKRDFPGFACTLIADGIA